MKRIFSLLFFLFVVTGCYSVGSGESITAENKSLTAPIAVKNTMVKTDNISEKTVTPSHSPAATSARPPEMTFEEML